MRGDCLMPPFVRQKKKTSLVSGVNLQLLPRRASCKLAAFMRFGAKPHPQLHHLPQMRSPLVPNWPSLQLAREVGGEYLAAGVRAVQEVQQHRGARPRGRPLLRRADQRARRVLRHALRATATA